MIALKKSSKELLYGKYTVLLKNDKNIYAYKRSIENEGYIIICNLSKKHCTFKEKTQTLSYKKLVLHNYDVSEHKDIHEIDLKPYECRVYKYN